jgi:hypothetical protein
VRKPLAGNARESEATGIVRGQRTGTRIGIGDQVMVYIGAIRGDGKT